MRKSRLARQPLLRCCFAALVAAAALADPAVADDRWNPFADADKSARQKPAPLRRNGTGEPVTGDVLEPFQPGDRPWQSGGRGQQLDAGRPGSAYGSLAPPGGYLPPPDPAGTSPGTIAPAVERRELAPPPLSVPPETAGLAPSGLASDSVSANAWRASGPSSQRLWGGIDSSAFAQLARLVPAPVGSDVGRDLVASVLGEAALVELADPAARAAAADTLYRTGLFLTPGLMPSSLDQSPPAQAFLARMRVAAGDWDAACPVIRDLLGAAATLEPPVRGELIALGGACAIHGGTASAGTLAAEMARDTGYTREVTLAILSAIGSASRPRLDGRPLSAIDARLLLLARQPVPREALDQAEPAALAVLATDPDSEAATRIEAAERAASTATIAPAALAEAYRAAARIRLGDAQTPATERAALFRTIEAERAFLQRSRSIRALLDAARRDGLYAPMLAVVAPAIRDLPKVPEIGWFAETAIESLVTVGDIAGARAWAELGASLDDRSPGAFAHWRALIDIGDPNSRGSDLEPLERLARQRQFGAAELHRLATVLDALNFQVPLGLWDAANASPQPNDGYLPETGTLRLLADSAKAGALGPTGLLTVAALGPKGPTGAHMIGLGDAIRALRRSGQEAMARRLAVATLIAFWPKARVN